MHGIVPVDLPLGKPLDDLVEDNPAFEARESGAESEVEPITETEVMVDAAVDVEPLPVGKVALVAVARSVEQHHDASLGHRLPVDLDVSPHIPRLNR